MNYAEACQTRVFLTQNSLKTMKPAGRGLSHAEFAEDAEACQTRVFLTLNSLKPDAN